MSAAHVPVLKEEVIKALDPKSDGTYLDLTLGRGGHALEILKRIPQGKLIAFDKDEKAILETNSRLSTVGSNFELIHSDFSKLKNVLEQLEITSVDGILIDLGVSSPQIDTPERGFSYSKDGPLDMRMDQSQTLSAEQVINDYSESDLVRIFKDYADVKLPARVAKAIVENRPINSTLQLVDVLRKALPAKLVRQKNPAKAVFQAIRIEVNNELGSLDTVLKDSLEFLSVGSKLAIITFHSIEDRKVKRFFGELTKSKVDYKLPIMEDIPWKVKTFNVTQSEIDENNRARSAKLRVLTRLK